MTVIPILSGDWEILLDDEKNQNGGSNAVPGMRTIQKAVATPTIVTTRVLYSAVAAAMDDFIAMGFVNSMLPTTPNAYTLPNQYFMPRSSAEFLKEGAITSDWSLSILPDVVGNGVVKVAYSGGTNFITTDIGRQVIQADSSDSGTLLDFDIDPDGTLIAWIRPDDTTPTTGDVFDGTGALSVVADGAGTGVSTASVGGLLNSGETEWAAIQAIGSVPTATEVYLYQDRNKITSSDGSFQWWSTDTTVSLGIISVLIQTKSAGVTIADGDVEVFARRYTSLFDNFRLNVSAGGFSALPLASAPDINNTTGYRTTTLSGATASRWEVGNGMYTLTGGGTAWADAHAKGIVTSVTNFATTTPTLEYYLVGDLTDFEAADVLVEYEFATPGDDDGDGSAGAPAATSGGPTDGGAAEGGTVTIVLGHADVDHDGNGSTEPYSITIDSQGNVPIAKVYERIKYVCRRGGDAAGLFGAGTNVPGESYRGIDGAFEWNATGGGGLNVDGDDILTTTGGSTWVARLIANSPSTTPTYFTSTDQQTSVDVVVDADVIEDETGTDTQTIGGSVLFGIALFTSSKASPFGTFTGSQIFGSRGVVFINPSAGDEQAYILTDDFGTLNTPPNTVSFTVSNVAAADRILVARDTAVAGIIDKNQFGNLGFIEGNFNGISDIQIKVSGSVDDEVPQAGYIRIVENTKRQEHHYVYASRTVGDNGVFTLVTGSALAGTADDTGGTTSTTLLNDDGQLFSTDGVLTGMLMRDTTNGNFYEIASVDSETQCTIVEIFGFTGAFAAGDGYQINKLIQDYATGDEDSDFILEI